MQPTRPSRSRRATKVRSIVISDPSSKAMAPSKLAARFSRPFKIARLVTPGAYELELPDGYRAHNVVSISHLQKYVGSVTDGRS